MKIKYLILLLLFTHIKVNAQNRFTYLSSEDLIQTQPESWSLIFDTENPLSMISGIKYQMKKQDLYVTEIEESTLQSNNEHSYNFVFASEPNLFERGEFELPCFGTSPEIVNLLQNEKWLTFDKSTGNEIYEIENILEKRGCYFEPVVNSVGQDSVYIHPITLEETVLYSEFCDTYFSTDDIDGIVIFENFTDEDNYPYEDIRFGLVKLIEVFNSDPEIDSYESKLLITFSSSISKVPNVSNDVDDWYNTIFKAYKKLVKTNGAVQSFILESTDVKEISQKFICKEGAFDNHFGQVIFSY
jgi:hypothetical protein